MCIIVYETVRRRRAPIISATSKTDGVRMKVPIPILLFAHTGIDKRMKCHKDPYDGKGRNKVHNTVNDVDLHDSNARVFSMCHWPIRGEQLKLRDVIVSEEAGGGPGLATGRLQKKHQSRRGKRQSLMSGGFLNVDIIPTLVLDLIPTLVLLTLPSTSEAVSEHAHASAAGMLSTWQTYSHQSILFDGFRIE